MRGIVLEIKDNRCVVMKKDGSFEEIRNHNYAIGQEITLSKTTYVKYLSVAACLILICTTLFGYLLYHTPTSFIYLDINPSIRLDINRFERVIDVVPLNDDAEVLLSSASVSQNNAQDCISDIVSACREQHYLNEQNTDIEVSVRTDSEKLEASVETTSALIEESELQISVFQMDEEENNSAMEHHISARRLRAVRAYNEVFGGTLEENLKTLQGVSSDEIYDAIKEYRRALHAESKPSVPPETENGSLSSDTTQTPQPPANLNDRPTSGHQLAAKRLAAIRAYTECFGGTLEENAALLQGVSSDEIYQKIDESDAFIDTTP